MRITARNVTVLAGLAAAAALIVSAPVLGAGDSYAVRTLTQPATTSLPVTGVLSGMRVSSRVHLLVRDRWRRLRAPAGTLRYAVHSDEICGYTVSISVATRLAPQRPAADYVAAALPSPTPRRLLDSGIRGASAFRVVRPSSTDDSVRLRGLWATVLTRRDDIAPKGEVAWTELRVDARSGPRDECHEGTWRGALGPQIGDILAGARTSLHFLD